MTAKTPTSAAASKSPIAARDFKDADTGRAFAGGKPVEDVEDGLLENYRTAGLLRPTVLNGAQQIVADGQDAA